MRNWWAAAAACALLACSKGDSAPGPPPPDPLPDPNSTYPLGRKAGYVNPIPAENALPGDPAWALVRGDGAPSGQAAINRPAHVEAYADRVSVKAGESLQ